MEYSKEVAWKAEDLNLNLAGKSEAESAYGILNSDLLSVN